MARSDLELGFRWMHEREQIPFWNDRKKSKDKSNGKGECNDRSRFPPGNDRKKSKSKCKSSYNGNGKSNSNGNRRSFDCAGPKCRPCSAQDDGIFFGRLILLIR